MGKKLGLPLSEISATPTVDAIRKRLGGRGSTDAGAGEAVMLESTGGAQRVGVVLFVRGTTIDVLVTHGLVRHVNRDATRPAEGPLSNELEAVAASAKTFASLREGDRVTYRSDELVGEGVLVEKCRFGGLVERSDGTILGLGFQRISAARSDKAASKWSDTN